MKLINSAIIVFLAVSLGVLGIDSSQAAGTSGALVLKQAVGARAQGMGEAFTSVADDATSVYWNVGAMSQVPGTQVNVSYLTGLLDSSYGQVMFTNRFDNNSTLGVGFVLFQGGILQLDQADGSTREVIAQTDLVGQVAYAVQIMPNLGVGLGVKVIDSTLIEEYTAWALAGDLGMKLLLSDQLAVGLTIQNVGTELKFINDGDSLPLTLRVGGSYQLHIDKDHNTLLALDLIKDNDQDFTIHTGAEHWYAKTLAVRLGYKAGYELESLTAGLGVRWQMLQIDYAFGLVQELNQAHKVSLSIRL